MKTTSRLLSLASCVSALLVLSSPAVLAAGDTSFISVFFNFESGAIAKTIVMWILLGMSILVLTFAIELFLKLRISKLAPPAVIAMLRDAIATGNYYQALEICRANKCYLCNVFAAALERVGRGRDAVENAVAEVSAKEANELKANNNYLSVIGVVAPMVGLTGTVLGMMSAFSVLATEGVADPKGLSGAIAVVLIATATGLIVAIPGFVLFYFFKNRAQKVIVEANYQVNMLLEDIPFDQLVGFRIEQQPAMSSASYQ